MASNSNNLSYTELPEPEEVQVEQTEFFVKLPYRFQKEEWFKNPNKRLVFTELCFKANWHDTTKIFKNQRCIVGKGECIIKQRELAKELGIPLATLNRILKLFTEIGEIKTRKTNVFTLISILYLTENNDNETPVKHQRNTRNVKYMKLRDVIDGLDKIDKIDNIDNNKKNEINFVDQNSFLITEEKTDMTTKVKALFGETESVKEIEHVEAKKTVKEPKPVKDTKQPTPKSFVDTLLDVWCEEYLDSRKINYIVIKGKDSRGISCLLKLFKQQFPDLNSVEMVDYCRTFFRRSLALDDPFLFQNSNPSLFYSQINKINALLLKPKKASSSSSIGQGNYYKPLK